MEGLLSVSFLVLLVAIVLGSFAQQQQTPPPFPTKGSVTGDVPVQIHGTAIDPSHVFSDTYEAARTKFRQAATKAGAELRQLAIDDIPTDKSLLDDYTIDVAILKGQGTGLVVHTCGVHGVEGYAGSPVQIAFLESLYPLYTVAMQEKLPTIVLVHAVNPYGMAHYRRTNENNVDLNRNAMHPEEWKVTNAEAGPHGIYEAYGKFNFFFNPQGPPTWLYALATSWIQAGTGLALFGFDTLKAALVTGQYYDEKGIFYGGQHLQPSLKKLYEFLETNIQDSTGTVTWIDVHTGLGPSGVDSILFDNLFGEDSNEKQQTYVEKEMKRWFPDALPPHLSDVARDAGKGYDKVKGNTPTFFARLFNQQDDQKYLAMIQEFGTVPGFLVAHSLIMENRAFQHLPAEQALEWARQTTKRTFYIQTPKWRQQILERGVQLLLQAIQRSSTQKSVDEIM